jgi:hypothetical protein
VEDIVFLQSVTLNLNFVLRLVYIPGFCLNTAAVAQAQRMELLGEVRGAEKCLRNDSDVIVV